ncbi:EscU/YscU/HrcU family type III secretion system export apparatus switch protein [Chromobacterium piscinae]|uniref:EscU/YscU/HrcU family type III secretion system export apparatus switch protein n=1 Tax=Chromobacterium piscinae TaxID=686831 RepID=A0ABV0H3Z9_9NEIS|nr:EscU/YscU/HrcU family type III secretion system export apparatus switch protein [Chromobacterium piscinae]MBX9298463.1 EscU/YscU/HrcU family type III secretion system export apparatus switch protein [Chromobacterium vaccinii]MBX9346328.1 EscU/YscU/HrcU family type III secretion system export apparatus switch protein [Chromobacterium vaccinii]MBX9357723.1 EscU/YscU/HrcU family type III secretion system export apparatus switch protein [Chromobacterium vaccinii]MCD4503530.1 EscU/YscU/HrcU famil
MNQQNDDKRRSAVALSYREGQHSPRVVAKGYGQMAQRIIDCAQDAGVFVHDSPELVSLLMQVDLDKHIPPELYRAVAEILAFIYYLERQAGGKDTAFEDWSAAGRREPAGNP